MYKEYLTVSNIVGPLVIVEKIRDVKYGELVEIESADGFLRRGTVLDISTEKAVVQVFEGTIGLDVDKSRVRFQMKSSVAYLMVQGGLRIEVLRSSPRSRWISAAAP